MASFRRRLAICCLASSLLAVLPGADSATAPATPASKPGRSLGIPCPVRPDRDALLEHTATYQGRAVHFCCADCVAEFNADSRPFIANLPTPGGAAPERDWLDRLIDVLGRHPWAPIALVATLLLLAGGLRGWRAATPAPAWQRLALVPLPAVAWLAWELHAQGVTHAVALAEARRHADQLARQVDQQQASESIHYATFHDFGRPPVPARPSLPPRVTASFYRGNDERSPRLFNHGNYRTCTFELALADEKRQPLDHGGTAGAGEIVLRLGIIRAPYTAEQFWSAGIIGSILLTRDGAEFDEHPPTDRVPLGVVEPGLRYEAWFPLGRITGRGEEQLAGIVYLCETMATSGFTGRRFHAAIQHELRFVDGVLDGTSDLWMGALYRTRVQPQWKLPLNEWFSHEPIPELPAPHATSDPKLLGLPTAPGAVRN